MTTNPVSTARAYASPGLADAEVARLLEDLGHAVTAGDGQAAAEARNRMWEAVYSLHRRLYAFDEGWNELAPRAQTMNNE